MVELLLYPQMVLLLAPILMRVIWMLCRPALLRMEPRVRAGVLFVMIVLPVIAVAVPYVPALAAYMPVPWRSPIAWGVANFPAPTEWMSHIVAALVAAALLLVPPAALIVLLLRASFQTFALSARLPGQPQSEGFELVPGRSVACTIGLWRPRVLLSADIWESEHGTAVLHHERAHARGHHPLITVLARASLALWRWVPGSQRLLDDLRDALEESADAAAVRQFGRIRVARAVVDIATARMSAPALGFSDLDSTERRVTALAQEPRQRLTRAAVVVSAVIVPIWLLLL